jgi:hypothetical protein
MDQTDHSRHIDQTGEDLPARDDPHALQTLMDTVESDSRTREIQPLDQHYDPTEGRKIRQPEACQQQEPRNLLRATTAC